MPSAVKLEFVPFSKPPHGVLIVFCDDALNFGPNARQVLAGSGDLVTRAADAEQFKGKNGSTLDILVPNGLDSARLVVVASSILLPQLKIFVEHSVRIIQRDDEPFCAEEKPPLEKIASEKGEKAVEKGFCE